MKRNVSLMILLSLCAGASAYAQQGALEPVAPSTMGRPAAVAPGAAGSVAVPRGGSAAVNNSSGLSAAGRAALSGRSAAPAPAANVAAPSSISTPAGLYGNDAQAPAAARPAARAATTHGTVAPAARRSNVSNNTSAVASSQSTIIRTVTNRVMEQLPADQAMRVRAVAAAHSDLGDALIARIHAVQTTSGTRGVAAVADAINNEIMAAEQHRELLVGRNVGSCTGDAQGKSFSDPAKDTLVSFEGGPKTKAALLARASESAVWAALLEDYLATPAGQASGVAGFNKLATPEACGILNSKAKTAAAHANM